MLLLLVIGIVIVAWLLISPRQSGGGGGDSGKKVVLFYAPWCGHCKRVKPIWVELASHYPAGMLEDYNDEQEPDKAKSMGVEVEYYPTIVKFMNGRLVEKFNGEATREGLKEFIES